MLDGVYTLCRFLDNTESLALQVTVGRQTKQYPITTSALGLATVWVEDQGKRLLKKPTPADAEVSEADIIVTNTDSDGLGHLEFVNVDFSPQNPTVTNLVNQTYSNKDCQEFMSTVLNNASTEKNRVLEGGDIQKIFADFLAQNKGGISRQRLTKWGTASGRIGTNGKGNGTLYLRLYSDPTANQDWLDAVGIVDELPHIAGSKGGWPKHEEFDDFALAQAVHKSKYDSLSSFTGSKNPFTAGVKDRYDPSWSNYFHDILRKYCAVPH
jgi:hypothetical protein